MRFATKTWVAAIGTAWLGAASPQASAADFYADKLITLINGSSPGGSLDVYARLLTKYMGDYIPGNPTFIVRSMPGAGGLTAANHIANLAPKDGTTIATSLSSVTMANLLSPDVAKFDAAKLGWLGSVTADPYASYVWKTAPAQTYADMMKTEVIMGASAMGSSSADMAVLSNGLLGTKYKLVTGYKSAGDVELALQKGELHGTFAHSWADLKGQHADWIRDKQIKVFLQLGTKRHKDIPDVPTIWEYVKTDEQRQALTYMLARQEFVRPFYAPPDLPADRLTMLRRAFDSTMKDPRFLEDIAKAGLVVDDPMPGEELAKRVAEVEKTPPAVIKKVEKILADYVEGKR